MVKRFILFALLIDMAGFYIVNPADETFKISPSLKTTELLAGLDNYRYATHSKIDRTQVPWANQFKFLEDVVAYDQAQMNMGIVAKVASYNSGLALYANRLMTLMRADCYGNSIPTDPYLLSRVSVKRILNKDAAWRSYAKEAERPPIPILSIAGTTYVSDDDFFALGKLWSGKLANDEVIVKSKELKPITSGRLTSTVDLDLGNRPNGISAKITTDKPGMVVFRENFYPGWHATIDGRPAPIYLTDYAFMGLPVDAGKHLASFSYMPLTFVVTILIFFTTVLCGLALLILRSGKIASRKYP